jgi:hypothetical protein
VPEFRLLPGLQFQFFQEPYIGKIDFPELSEVEKMYDNRNGNRKEPPEYIWMKKIHDFSGKAQK